MLRHYGLSDYAILHAATVDYMPPSPVFSCCCFFMRDGQLTPSSPRQRVMPPPLAATPAYATPAAPLIFFSRRFFRPQFSPAAATPCHAAAPAVQDVVRFPFRQQRRAMLRY
jgi:hypothetical protein